MSFLTIWSSIFGLVFVFRTGQILNRARIISNSTTQAILLCGGSTLVAAFWFAESFFARHSAKPAMVTAFAVIITLGLMLLAGYLVEKRKAKMIDAMSVLVSSLILSMKSGKSFRLAFVIETENHPELPMAAFLSEVERRFSLSEVRKLGDWPKELENIMSELVQAEREPHFAVQKLEFLRDRLRRRHDLGQRISHAKALTLAQSLVTSLIFIPIWIYQITQMHSLSDLKWLIVAGGLFFLGSLGVCRAGRKVVWNT